MLICYFSNNLYIYFYVGKLLEQHFSVCVFSNPGDNILFLLKFNEARISEWNLRSNVKWGISNEWILPHPNVVHTTKNYVDHNWWDMYQEDVGMGVRVIFKSRQLSSQLFFQKSCQGNCQVNCVTNKFLQGNWQVNSSSKNFVKAIVKSIVL